MSQILHVLSIGSTDDGNLVRDVLQARRHCHLVVAGGYRELCNMPAEEQYEVAVLHASIPATELRGCCVWIRRTWPRTRILLVASSSGLLDDPLYDERAERESPPGELLNLVESLAFRTSASQRNRERKAGFHGEEVCGR